MFEGAPGRIVRVYKDAGERRLAEDMAAAMARIIPMSWGFDGVTFIPATAAALRTRGFDHAQLLADQLSSNLGVQVVSLFNRPKTSDQRALGGYERIQNLAGSFSLLPDSRVLCPPQKLLLVDDVFTTGATLCAAADALLGAGVSEVYGLTFARV